MGREITIPAVVVVLSFVATVGNGAVADHVTKVEMSREYSHHHPEDPTWYCFHVFVGTGSMVQAMSFTSPDDVEYDLVPCQEEGGWCYSDAYLSPGGLTQYGAGSYEFTIVYAGEPDDTTTIPYNVPGDGPIPQVMQQPAVTSPSHLATNVPPSLVIEWDPCTDPAATGIGIELEPEGSPGISVEAHLPVSNTRYGPISLTASVDYELQLDFGHAYYGTNDDGITYVVDTDSEVKMLFHSFSRA